MMKRGTISIMQDSTLVAGAVILQRSRMIGRPSNEKGERMMWKLGGARSRESRPCSPHGTVGFHC